ncbi:MAG TPA: hypothetical protein VN223_08580 [Candidatus Elarobacter sp.]|nr:hypothetical protein [Candidatus Elarobacter sp.]
MKLKALAVAIVFFTISVPVLCAPNAKTSFESLKALAGQWDAKDPSGKQQTITWKVVSGGSVVMESMQEESMVTMYHIDNNRLMLTHYCVAQNQPRMQAQASDDGKTFTFDFIDATNLASPDAGHMRKLVLTIQDKDHFTEQWFFAQKGKSEDHGVFQLTRKQ